MPKAKLTKKQPAVISENELTLRKLFSLLLAWQAWLLIVAIAASFWVPFQTKYTAVLNYGRKLPYLFSIWGNYDGYHYAHVAAIGYTRDELPFFPLFPIMIAAVNGVTDLGRVISGQIVSHVAFVLSLVVVWKILKLDLKKPVLLVFGILLAFPTSHFYVSVYNDSLFFLFACLTILWSRERKWLLAAIAGALATLTRLNGLALAVFMTCEYIWGDATLQVGLIKLKDQLIGSLQSIWQQRKLSWLAIGLIPVAFGAYLLYIQQNFGDWHLLFSAMSAWGQDKVTFPLVVVWRYFKIFTQVSPEHFNYWVAVLEFLSVVFYCVVLGLSWKKMRVSYWVFAALSFLIPSLTGTFAGMPRYALHLYPFYLAIYLILKDKRWWVKVLYFIISVLFQIAFISLFTRGYFVT